MYYLKLLLGSSNQSFLLPLISRVIYLPFNFLVIFCLVTGPFADCIKHISPDGFFSDCVYDVCATNDPNTVCRHLSILEAHCLDFSFEIGFWRSPEICGMFLSEHLLQTMRLLSELYQMLNIILLKHLVKIQLGYKGPNFIKPVSTRTCKFRKVLLNRSTLPTKIFIKLTLLSLLATQFFLSKYIF